MKTPLITPVVLLSIFAFACGASSAPSDPTSTVAGKLSTASFTNSATATAISATDEQGARTQANLGADGSFHLDLPKAHLYTLSVTTAKGDEPMVFPRTSGQLDRTFRVSSGAATVALGTVHHLERAPQGGFAVDDQAEVTCTDGTAASSGDGECQNGKDQQTGQPCSDTEQAGDEKDADPAHPMAVPEKNPPNDVSGCADQSDNGADGEAND